MGCKSSTERPFEVSNNSLFIPLASLVPKRHEVSQQHPLAPGWAQQHNVSLTGLSPPKSQQDGSAGLSGVRTSFLL